MADDKFLTMEAGQKKLKTPIETSSGSADAHKIVRTNAAGYLDNSLLDPSIGAESSTAVAGENLSAWDLVYFYDDAGTRKVKKAIATSRTTLAVGYVKESASTGSNVTVYTSGYVTASGLNYGSPIFLSNTTAGKVTQTAPTTGFIQEVGIVISPTSFKFHIVDIVEIV